MLKIGITGGIGCGKTTIANVFETLGIPVYNADDEAKELMNNNANLKQGIIDLFGTKAYTNNNLDRAYIASLVFDNKELLERLNAIVHYYTLSHFSLWVKNQKTPCVLKEAALLFETHAHHELDFIIGVFCEEEERIDRILKRQQTTEAAIKKIIQQQISENIKMKLCDLVINNNKGQFVLEQILKAHQEIGKRTSL